MTDMWEEHGEWAAAPRPKVVDGEERLVDMDPVEETEGTFFDKENAEAALEYRRAVLDAVRQQPWYKHAMSKRYLGGQFDG